MKKRKLISYHYDALNGVSQISVNFHSFKEGPSHTHDFYEFEYILKGKTECDINGLKTMVKVGDMMVLTPGDVHTCLPINDECVETIVIHFHLENLNKELALYDFSGQIIKGTQELNDAIGVLLKEVADKEKNIFYDIALKNAFERVFLMMLRQVTVKETSKNVSSNIVSAISYINCNFTRPLSLQKLCEISGYTEVYFCRLFKKTVGCTYTEYLIRLRLNSAQRMLIFTDEPIINICFSCGFGSVRNFNREFKKKYGMTPSEYRQKNDKICP